MKKIILSVLSILAMSLTVNAGIIYVNGQATGANNGTSWADAYTTLMIAGSSINTLNGDSIFVAEGTYYVPTGDQMVLNENVRVFGGFPATGNPTWNERDWVQFATICDGDNNQDDDGTWQTRTDNAKRIFIIDTYGELNGLIVRNGGDASGGPGAGLALNGTSSRQARIIDCVFEYNSCSTSPLGDLAGQGGAIRGVAINETDTLYCENVTFRGNEAYEGGAILVQGAAIIKNCKFLNNKGARGSAIVQLAIGGTNPAYSGPFYCTNTVFFNNEAINLPNAGTVVRINNLDSDMTFTNCTFKQNIAPNGEGTILMEEGGGSTLSDVTYANCLFDQGMPGSSPFFGINEGNYNFYNCMHNYVSQADFLGDIDPSVSVNIILDSANLAANAPFVYENPVPVNGIFALNCTSVGVDDGADLYYTNLPADAQSSMDLAFNQRVSGLGIDIGAFEAQTNTLDLTVSLVGTTISCNETASLSYQWVDCANNNAPISGETGQSFTPTITGDYACELSNGCLSGITACETVSFIGIKEIEEVRVQIFPVPANNYVTVVSDESEVLSLSIFDFTGKQIDDRILLDNQLDIRDLNSGIYLLKIATTKGEVTKRFVKN